MDVEGLFEPAPPCRRLERPRAFLDRFEAGAFARLQHPAYDELPIVQVAADHCEVLEAVPSQDILPSDIGTMALA
jgi:hypothetical protein